MESTGWIPSSIPLSLLNGRCGAFGIAQFCSAQHPLVVGHYQAYVTHTVRQRMNCVMRREFAFVRSLSSMERSNNSTTQTLKANCQTLECKVTQKEKHIQGRQLLWKASMTLLMSLVTINELYNRCGWTPYNFSPSNSPSKIKAMRTSVCSV